MSPCKRQNSRPKDPAGEDAGEEQVEEQEEQVEGRVLGQGAEAIITLKLRRNAEGSTTRVVVKERLPKEYRHPQLDAELRRSRTRREAKLLAKAPVPTPRILESDREATIIMEYVEGVQVKQLLDDEPALARRIGELVAQLHDAGIIHGDLTTSNMILREESGSVMGAERELVLIDFGLSFTSESVEDKAVDLHLFKQALESKHHTVFEEAYEAFLKGYRSSNRAAAVLERLAVVERRGRNKGKGREKGDGSGEKKELTKRAKA